MYVKSNWFFILYKTLLVIAAAYGLHFHMAAGKWGDFNYYTVLSNAVCFLFPCVAGVQRPAAGPGCHTVTWRPRAEGAVVFCITVTFLIYHFILRPEAFRMGNGGSFYSVLNMVQHYIVPLMALLDWLLFCPKGRWRRYDPASWLLIPLAYFIYILIRAPFAGNIGGTSSPYPYSFIDIQAHGWASWPECAARGPRHVRARLPDVFHRPRPVAAGQADEAYASERAGLTVPFGLRLPDTCRRYTVGRFCFSERRGVPSGRI